MSIPRLESAPAFSFFTSLWDSPAPADVSLSPLQARDNDAYAWSARLMNRQVLCGIFHAVKPFTQGSCYARTATFWNLLRASPKFASLRNCFPRALFVLPRSATQMVSSEHGMTAHRLRRDLGPLQQHWKFHVLLECDSETYDFFDARGPAVQLEDYFTGMFRKQLAVS